MVGLVPVVGHGWPSARCGSSQERLLVMALRWSRCCIMGYIIGYLVKGIMIMPRTVVVVVGVFLLLSFMVQFFIFCFSIMSGIEKAEEWSSLSQLNEPELRGLKESLLQTVLSSRAPSTSKKYLYAVERWRRWADGKAEISAMPVIGWQFAMYLQHLANTGGCLSTVEEATNAIAWLHEVACLPPITHSPIIRSTMAGLKRRMAQPRVRKEPVTIEMLNGMARSMPDPITLSESRLLAMSLLAFAGFLRFDELAKLRCCDVSFSVDHVTLYIQQSKTDQYRDGASVVIAKSVSPEICPVFRLQEYIRLASIDLHTPERLFRAITKTKSGERLRGSGSISYTRIRELVMAKFKQLGYDASKFGLHSFRAGGASLAANAGVPDRLFKRHGRWKSESAKDGYVKDSLQSRLQVSKGLGLEREYNGVEGRVFCCFPPFLCYPRIGDWLHPVAQPSCAKSNVGICMGGVFSVV